MSSDPKVYQSNAHLSWDSVRSSVIAITSDQLEPFDSNTIANAFDVLAICQNRTKLPSGVNKGYWATVSFSWNKFELEVFEDRVEVYRFPDLKIDIWYEYHSPGQTFSQRFLDELATLVPE